MPQTTKIITIGFNFFRFVSPTNFALALPLQRRSITNNFQRLLGRISNETYLKMDYFCRKFSKSPKTGKTPPPDPRLDSMTREWAKTLIPLKIFGWCKCLEILGQNESYTVQYILLLFCRKIVTAPLKGADIYRHF